MQHFLALQAKITSLEERYVYISIVTFSHYCVKYVNVVRN